MKVANKSSQYVFPVVFDYLQGVVGNQCNLILRPSDWPSRHYSVMSDVLCTMSLLFLLLVVLLSFKGHMILNVQVISCAATSVV